MEKERILKHINTILESLRESRQYDLQQATGASEIGMKMYHDGRVHSYDHCIDDIELLKVLVQTL